jgi:hypothetical protein
MGRSQRAIVTHRSRPNLHSPGRLLPCRDKTTAPLRPTCLSRWLPLAINERGNNSSISTPG